ncbi:MAG: class I SAM-dependent methyltransferase [Acidobacteria bacterium]|nr:class I SAM-dependent methyltransferase [Acidobacteriota bacterium]
MAYTITSYARMIADKDRLQAYASALKNSITPNSVVLDLGCGQGIFAMLACKYGARRVYALEVENSIELARKIARVNGFESRIQFIQGLSTEVTLPDRVDIIVSDIRGVLPLYRQHLPAIIDARKRHLLPGGRLIPQRDVLWATAIEATELHTRLIAPWKTSLWELDLSPGMDFARHQWLKVNVDPKDVVLEPQCWATLDYLALETTDVSGELEWTASESRLAHGLLLWFEAVLAKDITYSNSPGHPESISGQVLLPWPDPLHIEKGDLIRVQLRAQLVGREYVWCWETQVSRGKTLIADYNQSSFFSQFLSPSAFQKRNAKFVPSLKPQGEVDSLILRHMDGTQSLDEISRALAEAFPGLFPSFQKALERVRELAERYT